MIKNNLGGEQYTDFLEGALSVLMGDVLLNIWGCVASSQWCPSVFFIPSA
jgi:hypothetical protein